MLTGSVFCREFFGDSEDMEDVAALGVARIEFESSILARAEFGEGGRAVDQLGHRPILELLTEEGGFSADPTFAWAESVLESEGE